MGAKAKFQNFLDKVVGHFDKVPTWLRFLIGVVFIIIGLAALFTPATPGSWLAIIGLELVGIHVVRRTHKRRKKTKGD